LFGATADTVGELGRGLAVIAALTLVAAVANAVGLARAQLRRRRSEFMIRALLGERPVTIALSVATEHLLLVMLAGVLGGALAWTIAGLFVATVPSQIGGGINVLQSWSPSVAFDLRVLLILIVSCVASWALLAVAQVVELAPLVTLARRAGGS